VSDNLATRIRVNQQKLFAELKPHYDFIVCGSGSSGSWWRGDWPRTPMSAFSCLKPAAAMMMRASRTHLRRPPFRGGKHDWAFRAKPNPRQAKSTIERTCHSNGYGQGFGWRVDGGVGEI